MAHRDYISQAPKVRVRPRMLKKLNFWTILKKKHVRHFKGLEITPLS